MLVQLLEFLRIFSFNFFLIGQHGVLLYIRISQMIGDVVLKETVYCLLHLVNKPL